MKKKLLLLFAILLSALTASAGNTIYYTSTDGEIVTPYNSNVFGATIVSNTYENGQGKIVFDGEVTTIGERAFYNCSSLTSVEIPSSVTTIGKWAFMECSSLTSVEIPNSVTTIGYAAFDHCTSLTSVEIPNSITTFGNYAFSWCSSLTSMVIPNSVTTIGNSTFRSCSSLTSVVIGNSVSSIENFAFYDCTRLNEIVSLNPTPPAVESNSFKDVNKSSCVLKVPAESVEAYKAANIWKEFTYIIEYITGLTVNDGEEYDRAENYPYTTITYSRTFNNSNWQPLYIPFSMDYTEWADWADVAEINDVHQYFNEDGEVTATEIEFRTLKSGSTRPNTPYVIKPKASGTVEKTLENKTLCAAENGQVDCSSVHFLYTLTGVYEAYSDMVGKYAMTADGSFQRGTSSTQTLSAQRFYLEITPRNGGYGTGSPMAAPKRIYISVDGQTTGIEAVEREPQRNGQIYNLSGQRVGANHKGIVIINGKKVIR